MSSARERQAKPRAKLKENPDLHKAYLEKDRKRKLLQLHNDNSKMSSKEREEFILKERIRMRELRASKQSTLPDSIGESSTSLPYRSPQSLGKAVKRACTSLPNSPRKMLCVVSKLAESVGLKVAADSASPGSSASGHGSALSEYTKERVQKLYHNSDISWQAPGRKDRIIIRAIHGDGERVKKTMQVSFLLMSLREAYKKFKEENPSLKVGLTRFCELRPAHVKLFDQIPHQVCVCSYHENVRLLLAALNEHT